jgi:methylenetetrahydrofolate reductase (NADPH)
MPLNTDNAVADLIKDANIEVIPLKGADKEVRRLPSGTTVTITCSPKFGLDRTFEHVRQAREAGYNVVPHIAARQVSDASEVRSIVGRLADMGVDDVYVIGGDASAPAGDYHSAADLLEEIAHVGHGFRRVGVACYPEGHPHIGDEELRNALVKKQQYADYMVSQLCFDAEVLVSWLHGVRSRGITLPLRVGLAAPLNTRKLFELSLKIGVGSSVRFLNKQNNLLGNLVFSNGYVPQSLMADICRMDSFASLGIEGIHLFSFNQIEQTMRWQRDFADGIPV